MRRMMLPVLAAVLLATVLLHGGAASAQEVGDERIVVSNACNQMWGAEAMGRPWVAITTGCNSGIGLRMSRDRLLGISGCEALYEKVGALDAGWTQLLDCNQIDFGVELAGDRIVAINRCGQAWGRVGAGAFHPITDCHGASKAGVSPNRLVLQNGCGQAWGRQGDLLSGPFVAVTGGCNSTRDVAVTDGRVAVTSSCQQLFVAEGPLGSELVPVTGCADARSFGLTPSRVVVANECGALWGREQSRGSLLTVEWLPLTPCQTRGSASVNDAHLAVVNECGQLFVQTGPLTAPLVPVGACGDHQGVELGNGARVALDGPRR